MQRSKSTIIRSTPDGTLGGVIEEDGKTEEEFMEGLAEMHSELETLDAEATELS